MVATLLKSKEERNVAAAKLSATKAVVNNLIKATAWHTTEQVQVWIKLRLCLFKLMLAASADATLLKPRLRNKEWRWR
ncbi:MAG: hypothetical protein P3M72_00310 [Candidatus Hodgkinia cicadicola]|nr:MAG: hypothetical protein P3M72_00310 [Candidatus Hodgkinia cicadicola]